MKTQKSRKQNAGSPVIKSHGSQNSCLQHIADAAGPVDLLGAQPVWCWVEKGRDLGVVGLCHDRNSLMTTVCQVVKYSLKA